MAEPATANKSAFDTVAAPLKLIRNYRKLATS